MASNEENQTQTAVFTASFDQSAIFMATSQSSANNSSALKRAANKLKFKKCVALECTSNMKSNPNLRFFRFPTNLEQRKIWLTNCKIEEKDCYRNALLCENHFGDSMKGKKKLKAGAIPTEFSKYSCKNVVLKKKRIKKCTICSKNSNISKLFKFPKEKILLEKWIHACGLEKTNYNPYMLICESHFEKNVLGKKKLLKNAVPTLNLRKTEIFDFNEESDNDDGEESIHNKLISPSISDISSNILIPSKVYAGPACSYIHSINMLDIENLPLSPPRIVNENTYVEDVLCTNCEKHEKNSLYYRKRISKLLKENDLLKQKNKITLKKCKALKKITNSKSKKKKIPAEEIPNENAAIFSKMILNKKSKGNLWTEKQKEIAQNIHYKSSSCYFFLRDNLGFTLPSKSSLHRWAPLKKLRPGFNPELLANLKNIISSMDDISKEAVILFDEVAIRKDLVYNPYLDEIEGLTDYGSGDRTSGIGKYICVFMVRGLVHNWKYVLSYFVSNEAITGDKLKEIVMKNLEVASCLGLYIRAMTGDQGPNNRRCFRLLGATKTCPFFTWNSKKIYCLFDVPHLIKSVRNTLMKTDISTDDGIVSWSVLQKLHELDNSDITKVCPNITSKHINPTQFDKMRVVYATQIFSRTVSAAITTCIKLGEFQSNMVEKAKATAEFIRKMDRLFDCLNSRHMNEKNMFKLPLRQNNHVEENLKEMVPYLENLKLVEKKTVYCIDGFIQSINGIISLSSDLFSPENSITFLYTSRLNQDPIENLFAQVRAKGGNNTNPSVFEFNHIVAKLMSMKIVTSSFNKNCEDDDDYIFDWKACEIGSECEALCAQSNSKSTLDIAQLLKEIPEEVDNTENNSLQKIFSDEFLVKTAAKRYFVGYAISKVIINRLGCENCLLETTKKGENSALPSEAFILSKNYSSDTVYLQLPSDSFMEICMQHFEVYETIFKNHMHICNIKKTIFDACMLKTKDTNPEWFSETDCCFEHRKAILDFLLLVLLRKNCTFKIKNLNSTYSNKISSNKPSTSKISSSKTPARRKLKIIKS